jgi:hypothetical protein
MDDELERIYKEAVMAQLAYYPGIRLEEVRETTTTVFQHSRHPGQDSNTAPSEYDTRDTPTCSVRYSEVQDLKVKGTVVPVLN